MGILALTVKELKMMMILPLRNIFYSAITHLILKISQYSQPTTIFLASQVLSFRQTSKNVAGTTFKGSSKVVVLLLPEDAVNVNI